MRLAAAILALSMCCACDPVQRISENANAIRTEARSLADHGQATGDAAVVAGAERIDALAAGIHDEIPGVTNKVPEWLSTLKWWGIAVAVVAVAFVLWNSGILSSLRIALGLLPRRKVAAAELAVSTLDDTRPESERELVALLRSDPEFDSAYRNAKRKREST